MATTPCRTCGGGSVTATGGVNYIADIGLLYQFEVLDSMGDRVDRYKSAIAAATAARGLPGSTVHVLNPPEPVS